MDDTFVPAEGCEHCKKPVEDECVRLGMFNRWHAACLICGNCGESAEVVQPNKEDTSDEAVKGDDTAVAPTPHKSQRRLPPRAAEFFYEQGIQLQITVFAVPTAIFCILHRTPKSLNGFNNVSRLEQYAFLLHIALRRLYVHFRVHHELPSSQSGRWLQRCVADHCAVLGRTLDESLLRNDLDVKRVKSVTLDRKLSSTARLPQRSTVVESPAGRIADASGQVVSARGSQHNLTIDTAFSPDSANEDTPTSSSVDVLRPAFARNNTSVLIVNENSPSAKDAIMANSLSMPSISQEDDAITLSDIPLLADQTMRDRPAWDGRPLLSALNPVQSLIVKHFALLQLQKTPIGHLVELDDILELLDSRKSQWWNKIFKGKDKKDQKKKGQCFICESERVLILSRCLWGSHRGIG